MNTLTEEELTAVSAAGDPVATWPVVFHLPSPNLWLLLGLLGIRNGQPPPNVAD